MFYRLKVGTVEGEERGYQWRDIDQDTFVAIATGTRPLGDADSQTRDSTQVRADAANRPMYYLAVWHNGWTTDLTQADAESLYATSGRETPGT